MLCIVGLEMEGIKGLDRDECIHTQGDVEVEMKCRKLCLCQLLFDCTAVYCSHQQFLYMPDTSICWQKHMQSSSQLNVCVCVRKRERECVFVWREIERRRECVCVVWCKCVVVCVCVVCILCVVWECVFVCVCVCVCVCCRQKTPIFRSLKQELFLGNFQRIL